MRKDNKYNHAGPSAEDRALEKFAEMMIEKISTLQSDWKKPWFTEGALTWPKNLSGREYNGMNAMMLMMHCEKEGFKLPVFCTFDRVVGLNYGKDKEGGKVQLTDAEGNELPKVSINKGSKSIPVFITTFTCVDKETKEKIKYDDYKRLSEEEKAKYNVYPKLSVYNVFNVDQTNLKEARPELYHKLEEQNQQVRPQVAEGEEFSFKPVDHIVPSSLFMVTMPITAFQRRKSSFLRNHSSRMVSPSIAISSMRWLIQQVLKTSWTGSNQPLSAVRNTVLRS